jgi:hypothetical protein
VVRKSISALKALMKGWMSQQPGPELGERVNEPGKEGRKGAERIPFDQPPSRLDVEEGKA